jgi:hypothetical protein
MSRVFPFLFFEENQTLSDAEYIPFCEDYMVSHTLNGGFAKPGSESFTSSGFYFPAMYEGLCLMISFIMLHSEQLWVSGNTAVAVMSMPTVTTTEFGAPESIYLNVTVIRNVMNEYMFVLLLIPSTGERCFRSS